MPKESVAIELGGKTYHLRYTFNALIALEDELGIPISDIGSILSDKVKLRPIRALVWAGLIHEDKGLTLEGVGEMLGLSDLAAIAEKVGEAFMLAFPDAEDTSKNEPSQAGKSKPGTGSDT